MGIPLTTTDGRIIDSETFEPIGRAEGTPTQAPVRAAGSEVPFEGKMDMLTGIVTQGTWGLQNALFSIPDNIVYGIAKGLDIPAKEVTTLGKLFKKATKAAGVKEIAPKNAAERYARAIGEGVGASLPFTGIIAWAGRGKKMSDAYLATKGGAGVIEGIADDAIKFFQQSPKTAVALDLAFGAGYEGLRQAAEENIDPANPNKEVLKDFLPMAGILGFPAALNVLSKVSPTVLAAKYGKEKLAGGANLGEIEKGLLDEIRSGSVLQKIPGMGIARNVFMKNAEKKLADVFGPVAESPEAQRALAELDAMLRDPDIASAGFVLNVAEQTMSAPLARETKQLLESLGPAELRVYRERHAENQAKLGQLFDTFTPAAREEVSTAFLAAQKERQDLFNRLVRENQELTDAELMSLSERLGPQNLDMLNNELRGVIQGNMEMSSTGVRQALDDMGLSSYIAPDGTLLSTRDPQGLSIPVSQDMEQQALAIIEKYMPNRPSMRKNIPEPIRILNDFVSRKTAARDGIIKETATDLLETTINTQLRALPEVQKLMELDSNAGMKRIEETTNEILLANRYAMGEKLNKGQQLKISEQLRYGNLKIDKDGTVQYYVRKPTANVVGESVTFNAKQLRADAELIASEKTKIDINVPEALDYLQSAIRFRHDAVNKYNAALLSGRGTRITDAKQILDQGDAVFKDMESLIKGTVPKINENYGEMQRLIDNYKGVYEQNLPLLLTAQKTGGRDYLLPNEDLLSTAFKNAERLRQLTRVLGPDADRFLETGAMDWLGKQNIRDKDGLVDPNKIRAVLSKNDNIVSQLPDSVQAKLADEVAAADDVVARLADINDRRIAAMDEELERVLTAAARTDADPSQTIAKALKDPALMRKLVDSMKKDPEMINALRRSVFDIARKGVADGAGLERMLQANEKSLSVLYGGTKHLQDLKNLASLDTRINMFRDVVGQVPPFQSLDESLKSQMGFGTSYITTKIGESATGRMAPRTAGILLGVRLMSTTQQKIHDRLFLRALEDEKFANAVGKLNTDGVDTKALEVALGKIGLGPSFIAKNILGIQPPVLRASVMEAQERLRGEQLEPTATSNLPVMSARDMLRKLPPAPSTRGVPPKDTMGPALPAPRPASAAQGPQAATMLRQMYPALFPNDPISGLLQQRQAGLPQ